MNVSQPTVSRIVFRVSLLIGSLMTEYIKIFPGIRTIPFKIVGYSIIWDRETELLVYQVWMALLIAPTLDCDGRIRWILVGDGGYPCLPFLIIPLRNPQTEEEIRYNEIQIRTRQIVERTFGVWHSCRRR